MKKDANVIMMNIDPYQSRDGHCIPGRFDDYNLFINGGKYFNYNDLAIFSEDRNKAGGKNFINMRNQNGFLGVEDQVIVH